MNEENVPGFSEQSELLNELLQHIQSGEAHNRSEMEQLIYRLMAGQALTEEVNRQADFFYKESQELLDELGDLLNQLNQALTENASLKRKTRALEALCHIDARAASTTHGQIGNA